MIWTKRYFDQLLKTFQTPGIGKVGRSDNGNGKNGNAHSPGELILTEEHLNPFAGLEAEGLAAMDDDSAPREPLANTNDEARPATKQGVAIDLRDVVKIYSNAAGDFPALKGINLQLNYGEFVSVVGKSGSGKSTLLNMITGIDHPTSGCVMVGNEDIYAMNESRRALWRGRTVGIVFQFFQLLPTLTLLENTMLPMDYCNIYGVGERPEHAMELLRTVGLEEQAHKLPASVSSGQQQSAAIARALATDPPILVADEPTGNLDSRSAARIIQFFDQLASQGKTILIVTHDPSITEKTDRTVVIADGLIVADRGER